MDRLIAVLSPYVSISVQTLDDLQGWDVSLPGLLASCSPGVGGAGGAAMPGRQGSAAGRLRSDAKRPRRAAAATVVDAIPRAGCRIARG
jgi:hypothetical protein